MWHRGQIQEAHRKLMGFASPGRARGSDESGLDDGLCILNAGRHHGAVTIFRRTPKAFSVKCSTPIGITGTGTTKRARCSIGVTSAQRRLASRGRAPLDCQDVPRCQIVLNADWHHGDGHTAPPGKTVAASSAQRRLASRGRAPTSGGTGATATVCSTPIGITGTGTSWDPRSAAHHKSAQRRLASRGRAQPTG